MIIERGLILKKREDSYIVLIVKNIRLKTLDDIIILNAELYLKINVIFHLHPFIHLLLDKLNHSKF